jgi:hypothetical protein
MADLDSFDVHHIETSSGIKGLGASHSDQHKKGRQQPDQEQKDSKEFFHTISKAAEASNEKLARLKLPYRFRVYTQGDDLFIDVVVLDQNGNIVAEKKKNLSHQDFDRLIEDVSQIEGLFVDRMA